MNKFTLVLCTALCLCFLAKAQIVNVANATELQAALTAAKAGQTIKLKDGTYTRSGGFIINAGINGTKAAPVKLQGTKAAFISSGSTTSGNGLWLKGNNFWILEGFTVNKSKKAIMLDNSHNNILINITVNNIGDEGIHLRTYSSYNTVKNCYVDSVGSVSGASGTAEGIYIGSSVSNWTTYTGGNPDTCNYNTVSGNSFGPHIPSENLDVKEGTKGGIISNNTFNGAGLNGVNSGDSWLDLKGNYYSVFCNTGSNTLTDGFQTHILVAGSGDYNTFYDNTLTVGSSGYGINVQTSGSKGTADHNMICSNNKADESSKGISNIAVKSCNKSCLLTGISNSNLHTFYLYPNPADDFIELVIPEPAIGKQYIISNVLGIEMKTAELQAYKTVIDISTLPEGCYFIFVPGLKSTMKFIKR